MAAVCLALVGPRVRLDQLRGYHSPAGAALVIALLSAGAYLERTGAPSWPCAPSPYLALTVVFHRLGPGEPVSEFVTFYLAVCLAWGTGAWLRSTRIAEAERRHRVAEDSRAAERARIARELHDVVTHHVTAMVVQAEAARYLTAAPDRLDRTLTARHRHRPAGHHRSAAPARPARPRPRPEARTPPAGGSSPSWNRAAGPGRPVEFTEEGTPASSTGSADLVAYRVVQEALTNALKHARGGATRVRVRHGERQITVEVGTDGSGAPVASSPGGSGRGLAGLRERVDVLGGDFSAGPEAGGGFVVRARIPTGSTA
ncbi:histidine kinase [Streptomyces heliomycini]